ncbi:TPA: hypothetical protein ACJHBC_002567, partial [Escherichia coli]
HHAMVKIFDPYQLNSYILVTREIIYMVANCSNYFIFLASYATLTCLRANAFSVYPKQAS